MSKFTHGAFFRGKETPRVDEIIVYMGIVDSVCYYIKLMLEIYFGFTFGIIL